MSDDVADSASPGPVPPITFPDLPHLELDELLTQLVERAGEVMASQGRLRGLLRANQAIIADLDLPVVLRRIVDSARELVGARYAALGVLAPDGRLADLVHAGMPEETVRRIGDLPQGKGLLGAVIDEAESIRLAEIASDGRSSGFPEHHPPMSSFLGVPIRVRGEVFGNLYLAESSNGEFSKQDEELTRALAVTAAVAIDNARLYQATTSRGRWLAATAAVTRRMLDPAGERPLAVIAEHSRDLVDADLALIVFPSDTGEDMLRVDIAVGSPDAAEAAAFLTRKEIPIQGSITGYVFRTREPLRLPHPRARRDLEPALVVEELAGGPTLVVPLVGSERTEGVLLVVRRAGRPLFAAEDVDMVSGFANQAAVALELAEARAERERVGMLDERERIAADLHDNVIQRLFAAGLSLQSVAARLGPGAGADRLLGVIGDLDETITQIRTSIFALYRSPDDDGLRSRILAVVEEYGRILGFTPVLRVAGPVDSLLSVDGEGGETTLVDDLLAVLREALSNVARHSRASHVDVDLMAESTGADPAAVTLVIRDDGVGPGTGGRRSGLGSLHRRAERRGGAFTIEPARPRGTTVRWSAPI